MLWKEAVGRWCFQQESLSGQVFVQPMHGASQNGMEASATYTYGSFLIAPDMRLGRAPW